jgi:hypothetical protein
MSLKQRVPFLRWSVWRLAIGARNITKTGQIGDGREAAAADYVVANARQGDIGDVIDASGSPRHQQSRYAQFGSSLFRYLAAQTDSVENSNTGCS